MQKTSEQIYNEVEAGWTEARLRQRRKWWRRLADIVAVVLPYVFVTVLTFVRKLDPLWMICAAAYSSLIYAEVRRRWELEDRVERLEAKR